MFPINKVDVEKDSEKVVHEPWNENDRYNWDLWEKYAAEVFTGTRRLVCNLLGEGRFLFSLD
jgi:hypothetical protein